jgi:hypothetical protein
MRRVLPVLAVGTALALLVVGLGTALNAETPPLPEGSGSVTTNASPQDGLTPSKWTETDGIRGKTPKRS